MLVEQSATERAFVPRAADAPYRIWGDHLESTAVDQLKNACQCPLSVAGALMPDAHVGYGLPIGGVLATRERGHSLRRRRRHRLPHEADGPRLARRARSTAPERLTRRSKPKPVSASAPRSETAATTKSWTTTGRSRRITAKARTRPGRSSAPAAAAITSSNSACSPADATQATRSTRRIPRPPQPQRQPRHRRAVCDHYSQVAIAATRPPHRTQSPRLAPARQRSRPGILGSHGTDGRLRRRQSRRSSTSHVATRSARGPPRRREPPQLRVERSHLATAARKSSSTAKAPPPPAKASSASSPAPWPHPASSSAARASPRSLELGGPRRRPADEPQKAKETFTWDTAQRFLRERRRHAAVRRPRRGADGLQGHRRGDGGAKRSRRAAGAVRASPRQDGPQW